MRLVLYCGQVCANATPPRPDYGMHRARAVCSLHRGLGANLSRKASLFVLYKYGCAADVCVDKKLGII